MVFPVVMYGCESWTVKNQPSPWVGPGKPNALADEPLVPQESQISESESERKPEVPASTRDEALFHCDVDAAFFPVSLLCPGQRIHQQSQRDLCVWTCPWMPADLIPRPPHQVRPVQTRTSSNFYPFDMLNSHPWLFTQMGS